MLKKNNILGVGITNETPENILEYIQNLLKTDKKFYIVTPNPEILVHATKNPQFKKTLNEAEIALPDGSGLFLASIFVAKPFKQRIPGVDFMDFICKNSVRKPISMGFLGGKAGIAHKTAECLKKKYPWLRIVFVAEEWDEAGFNWNKNQESGIRNYGAIDKKIKNRQESPNSLFLIHNSPKIDILFVAFGHPKQEEWIYKNLDHIPVKCAMGVGGAFDYIGGRVKRAPLILRALGFEWLYRLIKQPWRWRRQLALLEFVQLIIKERFNR